MAHGHRPTLASRGGWVACLLAWLYLWAPAPADAQAEASCNSPQEAARSLVDFLQSDRWEPEQAWRCLDIPAGMSKAEAEVTAIRLKKVLDARGLPVPVDELSLDPNYKNSVGGQSVRPVVGWPSTWPPLEISRAEDGRWLYSRGVVQATPRLYRDTFSGIPGWIQQRMPGWAEGPYLGLHSWQLVYMVLLTLVALMAGLIAQRLVADRFVGLARRAVLDDDPVVDQPARARVAQQQQPREHAAQEVDRPGAAQLDDDR